MSGGLLWRFHEKQPTLRELAKKKDSLWPPGTGKKGQLVKAGTVASPDCKKKVVQNPFRGSGAAPTTATTGLRTSW